MKAIVQITNIFVNCPQCRATIYDPDSGSAMHDLIALGTGENVSWKCPDCGAILTLPAWAIRGLKCEV